MDSKKRKLPKHFETEVNYSFMNGVNAYIMKAGIENARMKIFKTQLKKYGGSFSDELTQDTTYIIVEEKIDITRLLSILQVETIPGHINVVNTNWLSRCFREKSLVNIDNFIINRNLLNFKTDVQNVSKTFEIYPEDAVRENKQTTFSGTLKVAPVCTPSRIHPHESKQKRSNECESGNSSEYETSDDDVKLNRKVSVPSTEGMLKKGNWVCAQSSLNPIPNLNSHITEKLEEMVKKYESTSDKWRAFGYQKAIQVLKKHPKQITTWEEAKSLPAIGAKLADKIWEIIESGGLRKLDEFKSSEEIKTLELFSNVWGAGAVTSRQWYQQGFKTLDDLKTKAKLTHQQEVGLKHYDDILDRMSREEAGEIEKTVRKTVETIQPEIISQACGSYRRGKSTCGDVDVLVTHPDGKSHKGIFYKLISKLKEQGFITDDLVSSENDGNQQKYLGVCKLPGKNRLHRRLDIIIVPYDEYACALVYFTGSAHFNRSLRNLAKKCGMSLSNHALRKDVVRKGTQKIYEGTVIPTPTEESVMTLLGVPYRPPNERDH
ncbi:DNA polymerase lambda-like isoform X1 [Mytilus trossulus]|uniref:DNA polymerase lambda-like isoform X1 n=1 Tax=Mytilus trossulus TaxID=6551 RepID=UPI003003D321